MSDFKLDLEQLIENHLFKLPLGKYGPENGFPLHAFIYVIIDKILINHKKLDTPTKEKLLNYQNIYLQVDDIEKFPNHHEVIKLLNSINV